MGRLTDHYLAARDVRNPRVPAAEALEARIAALYSRGRVRHPKLAVDEGTFAAHLARCQAPLDSDPERIHAEDLFLACAALGGDSGAIARLRDDYRQVAIGYAGHITTITASLDDLLQLVWTALLVENGGKAPRLAAYSGAGALAGFIGTTAQRIALKSLKRRDASLRAAERAAAEAKVAAGDAELEFIKHRYRDEFEQALRAAIETLDDRQRMILRMRVVDGLTVARIGKAYRVGQATMSRWIDKARKQVQQEMRRLLRQQLPLSDSDFEALVALLTSRMELSLSTLLAVPA